MLSWVQHPMWWLARRIYRVDRVGFLDFFDMRADRDRDHDQLVQTISEALGDITSSQGEFEEPVSSRVLSIAAMDVGRGVIQASVRGYVHPFRGPAMTSGRAVACRLVWVAMCIRREREAAASGVRFDKADIIRECDETQKRFVEQYPNASEWIEYLDLPS